MDGSPMKSVLCDCGCGAEVTENNRTMLAMRVQSERVCMERHWCFAAEDHRNKWWKETDGKPLFESKETKEGPDGIHPTDTGLALTTWLRDDQNKAGIKSQRVFDKGADIDKWWVSETLPFEVLPSIKDFDAAKAETGDADVLSDTRKA